jgi:hypothetical protein
MLSEDRVGKSRASGRSFSTTVVGGNLLYTNQQNIIKGNIRSRYLPDGTASFLHVVLRCLHVHVIQDYRVDLIFIVCVFLWHDRSDPLTIKCGCQKCLEASLENRFGQLCIAIYQIVHFGERIQDGKRWLR